MAKGTSDRQDLLTKLRAVAKSSRRMASAEPHLAGMWENIATTLDAAVIEIARLRDLHHEPRPGRGQSEAYQARKAERGI